MPVVVVTNGLEGTVQELLVPLLRYHASGLGVLVMEMGVVRVRGADVGRVRGDLPSRVRCGRRRSAGR